MDNALPCWLVVRTWCLPVGEELGDVDEHKVATRLVEGQVVSLGAAELVIRGS